MIWIWFNVFLVLGDGKGWFFKICLMMICLVWKVVMYKLESVMRGLDIWEEKCFWILFGSRCSGIGWFVYRLVRFVLSVFIRLVILIWFFGVVCDWW